MVRSEGADAVGPGASGPGAVRAQLSGVARVVMTDRWPLRERLSELRTERPVPVALGVAAPAAPGTGVVGAPGVYARSTPRAESSENPTRDGAPSARRDADGDQST